MMPNGSQLREYVMLYVRRISIQYNRGFVSLLYVKMKLKKRIMCHEKF